MLCLGWVDGGAGMTENEAIELLKKANRDNDMICILPKSDMGKCLIKALEEVQRWRTSVINPKIKNVFANTSTQICQNCDHKDEYIEELEAEVEPYRALEKRLTDMFGGELSLEDVTDELERYLKEPDNAHPINAKILTYEDAAAWDAYHAIGTPEECQAAMEKQIPYKPSRKKLVLGIGKCKCGVEFLDRKTGFCGNCGQKLDWEDEE